MPITHKSTMSCNIQIVLLYRWSALSTFTFVGEKHHCSKEGDEHISYLIIITSMFVTFAQCNNYVTDVTDNYDLKDFTCKLNVNCISLYI